MTNNKNLKLTLTALFGGVAALTAGVSAMTLTSCKPADTTVVLNNNDDATKYLDAHPAVINSGATAISQTNNADFYSLLDENLTVQNLANALVQQFYNLPVAGAPATGASKSATVKVDGNKLDATITVSKTQAGVTLTEKKLVSLTLSKVANGEANDVKLSGTVKYDADVNDTEEEVVLANLTNASLENTLTGRKTISDSALSTDPFDANGTYNAIGFKNSTGSATTDSLQVLLYSGTIDAQGNSTKDTKNLVFSTLG